MPGGDGRGPVGGIGRGLGPGGGRRDGSGRGKSSYFYRRRKLRNGRMVMFRNEIKERNR